MCRNYDCLSASAGGRTVLPLCRSGNIQSSAVFRSNAAGSAVQRRKQNPACSRSDNCRSEDRLFRSPDLCNGIPSYGIMRQPQALDSAFTNTYEPEIFPEKSRTFHSVKVSGAHCSCSGGILRNNGVFYVFNRQNCQRTLPYLSCLYADGCFRSDVALIENKSCRSSFPYGAFSGVQPFQNNNALHKIHAGKKIGFCRTCSRISASYGVGHRTAVCLHTTYNSSRIVHLNIYQRGRI